MWASEIAETNNERGVVVDQNLKGTAKVIEFPKKQSTRKRIQNRVQEQRAVLALSIASVLVMSVFLNQWLVQKPSDSVNGGNRNIASFENAAFAKDVKWEQHLAKRFSEDLKAPAKLAQTPTQRDELIFGRLEGKYGMKLADGQIQSLEFIHAQAGDQPLMIEDKAQFLRQYSAAFGLQYSTVSAKEGPEGEQVYNLINSSKQIVGTAHFTADHDGRIAAISIQK